MTSAKPKEEVYGMLHGCIGQKLNYGNLCLYLLSQIFLLQIHTSFPESLHYSSIPSGLELVILSPALASQSV